VTLALDTTALLGHSAGGVWALRYALAHPERVEQPVLIGPPALPKTRCPLPYRLMATPGVGALLSRVPPSPKSVLRFAGFMGERATLAEHPDLVDLFVVAGRDPLAVTALRAEVRELVSPFALLSPSGWRRHSRVRPDELGQLAMPTLLIWGEREPLGDLVDPHPGDGDPHAIHDGSRGCWIHRVTLLKGGASGVEQGRDVRCGQSDGPRHTRVVELIELGVAVRVSAELEAERGEPAGELRSPRIASERRAVDVERACGPELGMLARVVEHDPDGGVRIDRPVLE